MVANIIFIHLFFWWFCIKLQNNAYLCQLWHWQDGLLLLKAAMFKTGGIAQLVRAGRS